ncbi:MAG: hypothetical protein IPM54_12120 [Polyangiaceae bacterium]|nr:hypothetical protein [Polyangiaceae bacterium]
MDLDKNMDATRERPIGRIGSVFRIGDDTVESPSIACAVRPHSVDVCVDNGCASVSDQAYAEFRRIGFDGDERWRIGIRSVGIRIGRHRVTIGSFATGIRRHPTTIGSFSTTIGFCSRGTREVG